MRQKKISFEFEACGDGSLRKSVEKYGKVHGFLKNPAQEMRSADIILASSYLSSMEAFNNKKPVISVFDNPLKKDILQMTPWSKWITLTDDYKEVTNKIIDIARNSINSKKNIDSAYEWVCNQSWDNVVRIYLKLWKL